MHARLVNAWFFEVGDRRLDQSPSARGFYVAEALAKIRVIGRFVNGFAAMDEDDLAREINKIMHDRLPSFAVSGGTLQAKCDDSLCAKFIFAEFRSCGRPVAGRAMVCAPHT